MNNDFFLSDEAVGLRRITADDDLSSYIRWFNDQTVNEFNSHGVYPMTKADILSYMNSLGRDILFLSMFNRENNQHIGNISLQSIDFINRSAEFAIIVGERSVWGKGFSYRAGKLIIEHGFKRLNLHRIYCGTSSLNVGMQKLALKLGMELEGVRKEAMFHQGAYCDLLEYGMIDPYKKEKDNE